MSTLLCERCSKRCSPWHRQPTTGRICTRDGAVRWEAVRPPEQPRRSASRDIERPRLAQECEPVKRASSSTDAAIDHGLECSWQPQKTAGEPPLDTGCWPRGKTAIILVLDLLTPPAGSG